VRCDASKGKAPWVVGESTPEGRGRRRARPKSGFMVDARRAPPPAHWCIPMERGGRAPPAGLDMDRWQRITQKKKKRCAWSQISVLSSRQTGKVAADLVGLCFNCFSGEHVTRNCLNPSCCLQCHRPRHQANDCSKPRLLLGDHHPDRSRRDRQTMRPPRCT
jgi:hypothetical protein